MQKTINFITKLSKFQKITCLILLFVFTLLLPICIPTLANPNASINVGANSWSDLRYTLNTVTLNSNFTFSVEDLLPLKEKFYYISNDALTQEELNLVPVESWTSYSSGVEISVEGTYVIYVKIVDNADVVTYLNTDLLILDKSGSSVTASIGSSTWTDLRDTLDSVYLDREKNLNVEASDSLSGISSIEFYVNDVILNASDLNALSSSSWTLYSDPISVDEIGTYIVYFKVVDNSNNITYINTDYIVLNGYTESSLIAGRNASSYLNADPYITDKSTVTLNVNYSNSTASDISNYNHNLMSNILLPMGTKITLIDLINDKSYEYQITTAEDIYNYNASCNIEDLDCAKVATYPFTLFKEVGTGAVDKPFIESSYYSNGSIAEDFTIILDLSNTNIETNYSDVALYTELHDSSDAIIRPTLYSTIKKFNIYSNVNGEDAGASLYLNTNYSGTGIEFNSDTATDININSGISYKFADPYKITDTTFEDKKIGLAIRLVDSSGNTLNKENLRNIIFKVGNVIYSPESDNIIRIDLNNGIADVNKVLTVITCKNSGYLEAGTYYLKITNYASYDGYYDDQFNSTELSIPVNVSKNSSNAVYGFGVIMNDANRIISKNNEEVKVSFNILQNGTLEKPNIRVSLYKKNQLTAYNQEYTIVNLADYVSDTLNTAENNVYYVSSNPVQYNEPEYLYNSFELNLITTNFENNGYKFVFDLYDDTEKIGTIEKKFVVK